MGAQQGMGTDCRQLTGSHRNILATYNFQLFMVEVDSSLVIK